ncbi:NAD(P)-dependent oxidoreductase [Pelagibacterium limicola]|uniref:NAD(P)-dependent oxidoreductase n=1 Tax=Pelagibacterium limicola TaxID=2791022 RepID=UPI001FEBB902|nr:NAD(P)-dependent oxidoreductase [Pelagibacterium limicola]
MAGMNVLVFGAGFSGRAAIAAIWRHYPDATVAGTTRDVEKAAALEASGIETHVFDGNVDTALAAAIGRATHILASIAPGASGDPALEGAAHLIEKAQRLSWIGYYSTIGVYGDAGGEWIDETFPVEAHNPRIGWRLAAESAWAELAARLGIPLAILRLGGIYGPGRSGLDKLRNGTARRIVKPGQVFNRIHSEDIGEITALAAGKKLSGIFNIVDDEPAPPQVVIAYAAGLLGLEPPPEVDFETADLPPLARSFYENNRKVRNERIKDALGYTLRYPSYREGFGAILADEHRR